MACHLGAIYIFDKLDVKAFIIVVIKYLIVSSQKSLKHIQLSTCTKLSLDDKEREREN